MNDLSPLSWHQPPGLWRARGAHRAALQLGQSRPVLDWPPMPWQDHLGYTLWHYWAASADPHATWEALEGSEAVGLQDQLAHHGAHPWHLLALRGQARSMADWADRFGTPLVPSWQGDGLLHCAVWSGDATTVQMALAQERARVDQRDGQHLTALIIALYRGDPGLVAQLLQAGADPDLTDPSGRSALHHAALLGDFALMGELEDAGADTDQEDRDGRTAQALFEHRRGLGGSALRAHWAHKYADKLAF